MDEDYQRFEKLSFDEPFHNIKSFKYLQSPNYRNLIDFLESNYYQVQIFGHSCGLSDRTLLNTIFEHPNCISIKPFYHAPVNGENDYLEKSYAISRNFEDKSDFRIKVVNEKDCEPMAQPYLEK